MPPIDNDRPDPDALLARVQREQADAVRGKLRIYFGASAGVGKTYAMLQAARKLRAEGRDVVVGVIETHGRGETAALLDGPEGPDSALESLAPRKIVHRGRELAEFDLDAALARHPALILVDELAHANAPGSRHPKRWQDVDELLAAGIDVFTALNVQHLESLNDVVGGITGIRVNETVPDTFFDAANEVILVDLPPDELLKRLEAGKVYLPDQALRAAKNFFRKGNLLALREIALRRTADRVEDDVQAYRVDQAIAPVWKTEASLLCCVGADPADAHVVRGAARLASRLDVDWHALYVETPALQRLPEAERERILRTVRMAQDLGATTTIRSGSDVASVVVDHARALNVSRIIIGRAPPRRWRWLTGSTATRQRIATLAPDVDLIELGRGIASPGGPPSALETGATARAAGDPDASPASTPEHARAVRRHYALTVLACLATTLLATPLTPVLHLTNIAMLFLLTVVLVAVRWGRDPAVLAAFLSVALYDFFFVPPRFSFAVSDLQYLLTFGVMLAVALVIGRLTADLRHQARIAAHREDRARMLYEFARDLSGKLRSEDVIGASGTFIGGAFQAEVHVLVPGERNRLIVPERLRQLSEFEPAIAQWTLDQGKAAGFGTDTLPGSHWLYLPLHAPMRARGVLAIRPGRRRQLMVPEQLRLLETFAALVAIALERVHYVEVAQDALVSMESERLRNSLLSALSHDLRTPLAVLLGLADTLLLTPPALSAAQQDIVGAIGKETRRMNALVGNLLDMARIESGAVRLNRQWMPIEEVIGSALQTMQASLTEHQVKVDLPADLPLVEIDAMLIERVLVNLIENAVKYTPPGSTIRVSAWTSMRDMSVAVADNGPGVPERYRQAGGDSQLFDKFTRGERESALPGVGLGLAICRAIVEAHQGKIRLDRDDGGGARFIFTLPLGKPPVVAEEA